MRVRPGDGFVRTFSVDERIDLELRSAGAERLLSLQPVPDPKFDVAREVTGYVTGWLERLTSLAIGALLVLRRPESPAIRGLTIYLLFVNGFGWYYLPGGWILQWHFGLNAPFWLAVPVLDWLSSSYFSIWAALDAAILGALWLGWHRAQRAMRQRVAWIGLALAVPKLWLLLFDVLVQTPLQGTRNIWSLGIPVYDLTFFCGSLILGWAVLRHRVFGFGLVVQRALAFSIVSSVLLMALGLGKWLTESLLHAVGGQHSFAYDAAVAMAVVAVFAVVQRRITGYANRIFFLRWHQAAQALRDFVDSAAPIDDADGLQRRFVAAVDAFTGGQGSALYASTDSGRLERLHATLPDAPQAIEVGDELLIELQRGARRVDLTDFRHESLVTGPSRWRYAAVSSARC